MRIFDLVVEADREDHIARHGVTFDEVRDVVLGSTVMERIRDADKTMGEAKAKKGKGTELKASRIPTFRTVEEEAEFWDTHDITEFEDELEWVTDVSFGSIQSKDALVLRITGDDLSALVERADREQTNPAALARRWINERLGEPSPVNNPDS